jgi:predicted NAD/FAD-binding protein
MSVDLNEWELLARVIGTIMSGPAMKISFTLGRVQVNAAGFHSVFNAIVNGRIGVVLGNMPRGAAAAYDSRGDVFRFPHILWGYTEDERMAMLHESVHAMQDIRGAIAYGRWGAAVQTKSECEAAAYVAGSLYRYYATGFFPRSNVEVFLQANRIAESVTRGRTTVTAADSAELRRLIAAEPIYRRDGMTFWTPTEADGV